MTSIRIPECYMKITQIELFELSHPKLYFLKNIVNFPYLSKKLPKYPQIFGAKIQIFF